MFNYYEVKLQIIMMICFYGFAGYSLDNGIFDRNKFYYVSGRPGFANKNGNIGNVSSHIIFLVFNVTVLYKSKINVV